ncbi:MULTISPECIES: glucose-1-phosphate cytidylyltransferase [Sphingomonadaceae]|uniref:Glucose-1-phosphate cytidylyltransferase n=1 Tax=Novosphingobium clariflavum TaxID=2029884 RepID=A0ABV6S405_9SPHN|nr:MULTISPECIES: glucose-1-phosphate cytidylyltransferase [Sphingomonadaceae]QDK31872.1 glucose-1-phosphate cytidylyltransferase [Sphingomonas sp. IC081]
MKAVILAGGLGTRLGEETVVRPKPMVEIGGMPIIWHIMKIYSSFGVDDFIICLGYKGYVIKEFFANYFLHASDVTINLANNHVAVHRNWCEPWRITLVDTGAHTQTGGRLRAVRHYLEDEEPFCFTYGDGVSDVDIGALIDFHRTHGRRATITAVAPPGRFGALEFDAALGSARVTGFREKPEGDGGLINGGFFVLQPEVIDLIDGEDTLWEREPLETLAQDGDLAAYVHRGFWQPMDTLRDRQTLEDHWQKGAPWKRW